MSKTYLKKLIDHMFWSDAEVWSKILKEEKAVSDKYIREMLFHSHMTQDAFAHVWLGEVFELPQNKEYNDIDSVKKYAEDISAKLHQFLDNIDNHALDQIKNVPWSKYFKDDSDKPAGDTTLGDTILQVIYHSSYHRGQINRRLRELDIDPPLVDFIAWLWMDKPKAKDY